MWVKDLIRRYLNDQDGTFAVIFAISFMAIFLACGVAIDTAKLFSGKERIQRLADASVLYALNSDLDDKEKAFEDHFALLINSESQIRNPTTDFVEVVETDDEINIQAVVSGETEIFILHNLLARPSVSATSEATIGKESVEISLVLDISTSMKGKRLSELKKAATNFVESLLEDKRLDDKISISIVPYGGTVRVPQQMKSLAREPSIGWSGYSKYWLNMEWNQCLEFAGSDLNSGIKNYRKYKVIPDFYSFDKNNPWCPRKGNEFVPLTSDKDLLKDKIDNFSLSDGTGTDQGVAWGYENLNPDWKNKFPDAENNTPASHQTKTKKIMIVMTDGGITGQHKLDNWNRKGKPPFNSKRKSRIGRKQSLNAFYKICTRAKNKGIEIFTIGFLINKQAHENELKRCASSNSNHYSSDSGELSKVFKNIADGITPLRLSR